MTSSTVLLAIDGSEASKQTVDHLLRTTKPEKCSVILVGVVDFPQLYSPTPTQAGQVNEIRESMEETMQEIIQEQGRRLEDEGFSVEYRHPHGRPGQEICRIAEDEDVDEVIMGRRGRGELTELLLGSTSQYVVHHTTCPVTIIPGGN